MRSGGRSSSGMRRQSAAVSASQRELEAGRELDGAQHAQAVVAERRRVDRAQHLARQVGATVERILVGIRSADPRRSR